MITLFDDLSNNFKKITHKTIFLYVCGPTVYNYLHLGNARPIIVFDVLVRFLRFQGYEVLYIQNVTDIDDKIINFAQKHHLTEKDVATKFFQAYLTDVNNLHVLKPDQIPLVSENIDAIIDFIRQLIVKGVAYAVNGNVYFDTTKVKDYGLLVNRQGCDIEQSRLEPDPYKKNDRDFLVWKKTNVGVVWPSPWGPGRPGWHTECVTFISKFFKQQTLTIHGGGNDLKFPHHENERAQFVALYNRPLAKIWMHNGHLLLNEIKMSKSLNNVVLVKDFLKKYGADVLKWIMYRTAYRQPLNLTAEVIKNAQQEYKRVIIALKKLAFYLAVNYRWYWQDHTSDEIDINNNDYHRQFCGSLSNDLNLGQALTTMIEVSKIINKLMANAEPNLNELTVYFFLLQTWLAVIGLQDQLIAIDAKVQTLIQQWQEARQNNDFNRADKIRAQLQQQDVFY